MVAKVQAWLVALVLLTGLGRVVTYDPPPPQATAVELYGALLNARSARATVEVLGHRGAPAERAVGTIETAARRVSLRVETGRPYDEITDPAFTYVRIPGAWYRFAGGTGPGGRALRLLNLLSAAGPLTFVAKAVVGGVETDRFTATTTDGRLDVYVDRDGLPRRIELHTGNVVRLDLSDFLAPPAIRQPVRWIPATDLADAFRKAGER